MSVPSAQELWREQRALLWPVAAGWAISPVMDRKGQEVKKQDKDLVQRKLDNGHKQVTFLDAEDS